MGYIQNCEIWHRASLGPLIMIQEELICRTMWEPSFGHKGPYFVQFWERGLQDKPSNVNFGMKHPWAQWLRFRKNQLEGPCEHCVLAIKGPCLAISGRGATQFRQQSEIWHGASLGTLIKIQEEQIWRNRWGPCFGHKGAIFWPFLGKGYYGIHPELWNLA